MKKIIATFAILTALAVVTRPVMAETVDCKSEQYGGSGVVCGTQTSQETQETVETVGAGLADWSLAQIIAFAGVTALGATLLYKASYRWYLFG